MSSDFFSYKRYKAEIKQSGDRLLLVSNLPEAAINLQENRVLSIDIPAFIKLEIFTELEITDKIVVDISDKSKITELIIGGKFNNIVINGEITELDFGSCGVDFFNVEVNTKNLKNLKLFEATIHNLVLNNSSQNTNIYLGTASHVGSITTNQNQIYIYSHEYSDPSKIKVNSKTNLYIIKVDPNKYQLDF